MRGAEKRDFPKARNPAWGVRNREAVEARAAGQDFDVPQTMEMPANTLSALLRRLT